MVANGERIGFYDMTTDNFIGGLVSLEGVAVNVASSLADDFPPAYIVRVNEGGIFSYHIAHLDDPIMRVVMDEVNPEEGVFYRELSLDSKNGHSRVYVFEREVDGVAGGGRAGLSVSDTDNGTPVTVLELDKNNPGNATINDFVILHAGRIQAGTITLNSSGSVRLDFATEFDHSPFVVVTPMTTTSGVIAAKVTEVDTDHFRAVLGGTGFSGIVCHWIAIDPEVD
jgi:hypothetical protein